MAENSDSHQPFFITWAGFSLREPFVPTIRQSYKKAHDPIIAEPHANGCEAVGKLLFLAEPDQVLLPGNVVCIHDWKWPHDPELQSLEPHVTWVENVGTYVVKSWSKQVGDILQEGEVIGHPASVGPAPEYPEDEKLSYQDRKRARKQRKVDRLVAQLGLDQSQIEPRREGMEIDQTDVQLWWERSYRS